MTSSIYIAKNVYGGDGLGRLGDGRVVFVPGAFTGEHVKAEIVEEKRSYVKARLVEIEEASPDRITGVPRVPGMVYADLSYQGEVAAKEAQLREFFERARIEVGEWKQTVAAGARELNYRNKAVYHFAKEKGKWILGYRTEPEHRIIDIESDPLACPEINAKLAEIRKQVFLMLTNGAGAVRKSVEAAGNVTVRWTRLSGVQWWLGKAPANLVLKETTCGKTFEVPADGFYQVNPEIGEELVKNVAVEFAKSPTKRLVDLYCGVGVFGLACRPEELVGIESGIQAIAFAKKNAAAQGFANAKFYSEEVGRNLKRIRVTSDTTVVVDPPRGGMEPNVPKWLAASGAARIFYVSCDPATLTRDLKTLAKSYAVESVRLFNMFPRTARFETLVVLKRK